MSEFKSHWVEVWDTISRTRQQQHLLAEEPLSIRVQGEPYSVIMRTPGEEMAHVAGFCLAEGLIDSTEDYASLAFCDGQDTNVVTVTLTAARRKAAAPILARRGFVSQTSCGLCGKELTEDLYQTARPMQDTVRIDIRSAYDCLVNLSRIQPYRTATRASHAAALYSSRLQLLSISEDVGRHNALDKAIGKLLLEGTLERAALAVLSSRISFEMVQKAARARIPLILSLSRPTALAVQMAQRLKMTLASKTPTQGLIVYGFGQRLIDAPEVPGPGPTAS